MYEEILQKLGLSANEARIYELLLTKGRVKARDIVEESGLGRGNVYNILTGLVARGLATVTEGKQQIYQAAEPSKLAVLVEEQQRKAERLSSEFKDELPKLLSTFNLTTERPTMRVFEGIEGLEEAISDSLHAKGDIMTYLDVSGFSGAIAEVNARYIKKRLAKGVAKRIIVADSAEARVFFAKQNTPLTEVAFVPDYPTGFHTAMEIYNDSVTFLTMSAEKGIAVIVNDADIAAMQRAQFEFLWSKFATPPAHSSKE